MSSSTLAPHAPSPRATATAAVPATATAAVPFTAVKVRDPAVDIARLAAAVLIVLYHAGEAYDKSGGTPIAGTPVWLVVGNLSLWGRVPFFFFLAGCFAARSLAKPGTSAASFIRTRVKGLGIPYLFWNTLCVGMLAVALWCGPILALPSLDAPTFLKMVTGIGLAPADGPLWFVRDLIILSCLAPLLAKLGPWTLVPSILLIILPEIPPEWMAVGCPRPSSLGYFGIGMLLRHIPRGTFAKLFPKPGLGVLLCISVGVIHTLLHIPTSRLGGVSIGAMGILLAGSFVHRSFPRAADFLARHSSASFIIFAANFPFLMAARELHHWLPVQVPLAPYYAFVVVIFVILAVIFNHLLHRYLPASLTVISGGR